jgi:hypothetical protein
MRWKHLVERGSAARRNGRAGKRKGSKEAADRRVKKEGKNVGPGNVRDGLGLTFGLNNTLSANSTVPEAVAVK